MSDILIGGNIIVYSLGIVACSVCAKNELTPEEVEAETNALNPTGVKSKWKISEDKTFKTGESNPCPCDKNPKTRKHYLLNC